MPPARRFRTARLYLNAGSTERYSGGGQRYTEISNSSADASIRFTDERAPTAAITSPTLAIAELNIQAIADLGDIGFTGELRLSAPNNIQIGAANGHKLSVDGDLVVGIQDGFAGTAEV